MYSVFDQQMSGVEFTRHDQHHTRVRCSHVSPVACSEAWRPHTLPPLSPGLLWGRWSGAAGACSPAAPGRAPVGGSTTTRQSLHVHNMYSNTTSVTMATIHTHTEWT